MEKFNEPVVKENEEQVQEEEKDVEVAIKDTNGEPVFVKKYSRLLNYAYKVGIAFLVLLVLFIILQIVM